MHMMQVGIKSELLSCKDRLKIIKYGRREFWSSDYGIWLMVVSWIRQLLDGSFFTSICCQICSCLKRPKIDNESGMVHFYKQMFKYSAPIGESVFMQKYFFSVNPS